MRIGQITMTGSKQQIVADIENTPGGGYNVYCSVLVFQNNGANAMRLGDNTVTSTRGQSIAANGGFYTAPCPPKGTRLMDWYVIGTSADKLDYLYETAQ